MYKFTMENEEDKTVYVLNNGDLMAKLYKLYKSTQDVFFSVHYIPIIMSIAEQAYLNREKETTTSEEQQKMTEVINQTRIAPQAWFKKDGKKDLIMEMKWIQKEANGLATNGIRLLAKQSVNTKNQRILLSAVD